MRYPTRNGLIIPPIELGFSVPSPEALERRGAVTTHHGYYERARYIDVRFRSVFRNLVSNTYNLLAEQHQQLHEDFDAPRRPKDVLMIDVLDDYMALHGVIECVREKKTRTTYQIQPEEWVGIKKGYSSGSTSMGWRPSMESTQPHRQRVTGAVPLLQ